MNLGQKELVFNAQKFCIDNASDLEMYTRIMRKYAGDHIMCSEKYFNKNAELYVYVEWYGEKDFVEEFCGQGGFAANAKQPSQPSASSVKTVAKKILHAAKAKEENAGRPD